MFHLLMLTANPLIDLAKQNKSQVLLLIDAVVVVPKVIRDEAFARCPAGKIANLTRFFYPAYCRYERLVVVEDFDFGNKGEAFTTTSDLVDWLMRNPDSYLGRYSDLLMVSDETESWEGAVRNLPAWEPFWQRVPRIVTFRELLGVYSAEGYLTQDETSLLLEPREGECPSEFDFEDFMQWKKAAKKRRSLPNQLEAVLRGDYGLEKVIVDYGLPNYEFAVEMMRVLKIPLQPVVNVDLLRNLTVEYFAKVRCDEKVVFISDPAILVLFAKMDRLDVLTSFADRIVLPKLFVDTLLETEPQFIGSRLREWLKVAPTTQYGDDISLVLYQEKTKHWGGDVLVGLAESLSLIDARFDCYVGRYTRGETIPYIHLSYSSVNRCVVDNRDVSIDVFRGVRGGRSNLYPMSLSRFLSSIIEFGYLPIDEPLLEQFPEISRMALSFEN